MRRLSLAIGVCVIGLLVVALNLESSFDPTAHDAARTLVHPRAPGERLRRIEVVRPCHPDQHASWTETFHRTVTQKPSRKSGGEDEAQPSTPRFLNTYASVRITVFCPFRDTGIAPINDSGASTG